ncbi:MAG: hypothetical protein M1817_003567 [Caeruleum heppii]|nr:MAG: hypothetical protein M1817_003567 [Caeruleum heppii]
MAGTRPLTTLPIRSYRHKPSKPLPRSNSGPLYTRRFPPFQQRTSPARTFVSSPFETDVQSLAASRTLSYRAADLYKVIADVEAYSSFVPFCKDSRITKWSQPDTEGKRWPQEAEVLVGWSGIEERLASRIYCVPGKVLEAVGGEARKSIPDEKIPHHTATNDVSNNATDTSLFKHLLTTWTLRAFPYKPPPPSGTPQEANASRPAKEQTEVNLAIEFQFSNPVYSAMSKAVAPKIASVMIEAFERRASDVLGQPQGGASESGGREHQPGGDSPELQPHGVVGAREP